MSPKSKEEELAKSIDEAEWSWIKPHVARNAVIVIHPNLDLLDAGICVVQNHAAKVQEWISKSWMVKPTLHQIEAWDREPSKKFSILIVQPYVLIQEVAKVLH